jgi:hypothetical protein
MNRRSLLKDIGALSTAGLLPGFDSNSDNAHDVTKLVTNYYRDLPADDDERKEKIVDCADTLCVVRRRSKELEMDALLRGLISTEETIRRLGFGIDIFKEHGIATTIDKARLENAQQQTTEFTQYIPLVGSFNNLLKKSCAVSVDNKESVETFLYASLAFGIECGLFYTGVPYRAAWGATRYVSNRTLLRAGKHVGYKPVALAMSEVHWVIRGAIYEEAVTAKNTDYVVNQMAELKDWQKREAPNYDVKLNVSRNDIENYNLPAADDSLLPDFFTEFDWDYIL